MKKRLILYITMVMMGLTIMTGCTSKANNEDSEKEEMTIITSFYPVYLHTINIAKDIPGVNVKNMTEPQTGCLHDYQLSPDNLKTLERSDVFVINGGGMESFMDKVIAQLSDLPIINASEHIELISQQHGDHDHPNPHVWVSVSGAIEQVNQIAQELGAIDETNKDLYMENAKTYIAKLEELKEEMHSSLDGISNKNIVTFHEAFPYFAKEFGLNIVGTIVEEPGAEPSAKDLSAIIDNIKEHGVKAIFAEPQFTSKSPSLISNESGAQLYTLDPIVTGDGNTDQEDEYINKMKANLKTLEEALR